MLSVLYNEVQENLLLSVRFAVVWLP
jgi:hypothetical protein